MRLTFEEACSAVADLFEACPEMWCSGNYAKDANGVACDRDSLDACRFCAEGGIYACTGLKMSSVIRRLCPIAEALDYDTPISANDIGGRLVAIRMLRIAAGELPS